MHREVAVMLPEGPGGKATAPGELTAAGCLLPRVVAKTWRCLAAFANAPRVSRPLSSIAHPHLGSAGHLSSPALSVPSCLSLPVSTCLQPGPHACCGNSPCLGFPCPWGARSCVPHQLYCLNAAMSLLSVCRAQQLLIALIQDMTQPSVAARKVTGQRAPRAQPGGEQGTARDSGQGRNGHTWAERWGGYRGAHGGPGRRSSAIGWGLHRALVSARSHPGCRPSWCGSSARTGAGSTLSGHPSTVALTTPASRTVRGVGWGWGPSGGDAGNASRGKGAWAGPSWHSACPPHLPPGRCQLP